MMPRALVDLWFLFLHHLRAMVRMPVWVVIAIVQPMLWLLVFGQLFRMVATLPGFESTSYQHFLAPGLAVMSALMTAGYAGMSLLRDLQGGLLDRLLATPVSRSAILGARVLLVAVTVTLQSVLILALSALVGVAPPGGIPGCGGVLLASALLGAAVGAASNALALRVHEHQVLVATINFIMLPMVFLSSLMMSAELMPEWIRRVAALNPLNWGVVVARQGFEGGALGEVSFEIGLLAALGALTWIVALRAFAGYRARL